MKRILILLLATILLSACGSNSEHKGFTERYNENAYDYTSVALLDEEQFGEIKEEKYGKWKNLQTRDGYSVEAKYNDDDELTGYYIAIKEGELYYRYEGEGYEASQVLVKTLGLDSEKFTNEFSKVIETDEDDITYTDNDYEISIFTLGSGIIMNFDKNN